MVDKAPFQLNRDLLKACVHCGMCLPACPTYAVTGNEAESPRGRLFLMKAFQDGELADPEALGKHLDNCLGCQACETACPSGVQYGQLLYQAREHLAPLRKKRPFKRLILKHVLPNRSLLKGMGQLAQLSQQTGLMKLAEKLLPGRLGWQAGLLPKLRSSQELHPGMSFGNPEHPRVALLLGCVMEVLYNPVHWATIQVLVANGYCVVLPEGQGCCGALAHHAGEADIARDLARANVKQVLRMNPQWIVLNSAGCGAMLKDYDHLLAGDAAMARQAKDFASRVIDVMSLLALKPLAPMTRPVAQTVTYHAACHLHHAQKQRTAALEVLEKVPGLTLVPLTDADACCGSAGIYNVEHPELSQEILARKMACLTQTGAETVVTGNPGCMLQLEAGLKAEGVSMRVRHPIELVAQAYESRL
jgi:glycolate oxidase iron-sulfur subunit